MGPGLNTGRGWVVACPAADRRRFDDAVVANPGLRELRERGASVLRSFPRLLSDVYCFFYVPDLILRDESSGADKLHHLIVKYLAASGEYAAIRRKTVLDFDASLAAAERFGDMLAEYLKSRPPGGESKSGVGPAQQVKITGVEFADSATAGIGAPPEEAILVFAKEVEDSVDSQRVLADLCRTWGTDPGSLQRLPYDERAALARRIREQKRLRDLAEIVGRFRAIAMKKQQSRVPELPQEACDVTLGDDWSHLLPQELLAVAHYALRYDFYLRLLDRRVAQYELHGHENAGRGSLIVCIDTSGSMTDRDAVSKAIALALLDIARSQRRNYVAILFSSPGEWLSIAFSESEARVAGPGAAPLPISSIEGVLRLGSEFFGGGTDYETPLREAIAILSDDHAGFKDGDIVFLTDDQCEVSQPFLEEYSAVKAVRKFSTLSVLIGAEAADARTLLQFSDRVISSFELTEDVASQIFESV